MSAPEPVKYGIRAWLPIVGLAFAAFVFNTSEFLPVGLLPDIAGDLGETVAFTGLVITGYAWVVALMSLPLTIATAKLERRKLLLCLIAVFALAHFVVLWAESFEKLFAARIAVALTHSIFWSIMTPLAARMAPRGKRALGLAAVMGGTIVATVLGVPIGTQLGHMFGWQEAFFIIGIAAALVFALIYFVLPECASNRAGSMKSLPVILKRPALIQLYCLTAVTVLGQYTAYSYISPILQTVGGFGETDVVTTLFVFGIAGILGTVLSSKLVERFPSGSLAVPLIVIAASLFLIVPLCGHFGLLMALVVAWGAAMTAVCMAFQTMLLNAAPDAADIAASLYSGIFNIGIGGGAFIGSGILRVSGYEPIAYTGGAIVAVSAISTIVVWLRTGSAVLKSSVAADEAKTTEAEKA
ncbi:sugar transporter [Sutterella massiliensis]|uniref:Sugar transporter n=1 Tax=Sutterella massiliensis TaxID=1816689 RepID=A0ABS2DPP7_9BURK|nr:sugar transporter [Sutterella massiliensis]MBM6703309.1 sugar transporter [Sutterella massiliensis]